MDKAAISVIEQSCEAVRAPIEMEFAPRIFENISSTHVVFQATMTPARARRVQRRQSQADRRSRSSPEGAMHAGRIVLSGQVDLDEDSLRTNGHRAKAACLRRLSERTVVHIC